MKKPKKGLLIFIQLLLVLFIFSCKNEKYENEIPTKNRDTESVTSTGNKRTGNCSTCGSENIFVPQGSDVIESDGELKINVPSNFQYIGVLENGDKVPSINGSIIVTCACKVNMEGVTDGKCNPGATLDANGYVAVLNCNNAGGCSVCDEPNAKLGSSAAPSIKNGGFIDIDAGISLVEVNKLDENVIYPLVFDEMLEDERVKTNLDNFLSNYSYEKSNLNKYLVRSNGSLSAKDDYSIVVINVYGRYMATVLASDQVPSIYKNTTIKCYCTEGNCSAVATSSNTIDCIGSCKTICTMIINQKINFISPKY